MKRKPIIVALGPLPPPVHGLAAVTSHVLQALGREHELYRVSTSPGSLTRGVRYHLRKATRVLAGALLLARRCRASDRCFYSPVDASWGSLYTAGLTALARVLGYRVTLHHHSFSYIDRWDARMSLLTRCAGREALHVLLCSQMAQRYKAAYPSVGRTLILSNAFLYEQSSRSSQPNGPLRLGHLSNLCRDKGFDLVLNVFRDLLQTHPGSRLVLAGPPLGSADRAMLERARHEFRDSLCYLGSVDEREKSEFFRSIDVFVFPTRYKNEAQPLVVIEALAHGVPVLAWARGCVGSLLAEGGGVAVDPGENFLEPAIALLRDWADDRPRLVELSREAHAQFSVLSRAATGDLDTFLASFEAG